MRNARSAICTARCIVSSTRSLSCQARQPEDCESPRQLHLHFQVEAAQVGRFDDPTVGSTVGTDVPKFLNRMLGLKISQQALLFNYFFSTLKAAISDAKTEGVYSSAISDVEKKNIVSISEPSVLWTDPVTQLTTFKHEYIIDRGLSFQEACQRLELERNLNDLSGFYKSKQRMAGGINYVLAIERPGPPRAFRIYRPNTGLSAGEKTPVELMSIYVRTTSQQAKAAWNKKYVKALTTCVHGVDCPKADTCTVWPLKEMILDKTGCIGWHETARNDGAVWIDCTCVGCAGKNFD